MYEQRWSQLVHDLLVQRPAVVNLLHMTTCRKEKPLPACMSVEAS